MYSKAVKVLRIQRAAMVQTMVSKGSVVQKFGYYQSLDWTTELTYFWFSLILTLYLLCLYKPNTSGEPFAY